jgi:hypothetical protein
MSTPTKSRRAQPDPSDTPPQAEQLETVQTEMLVPVTLDELERSSEAVCRGPSGHVYRVRRVNLQRHVLEGGLPAGLREIGMEHVATGLDLGNPELLMRPEMRDYLDAIVRLVIVEPDLTWVDTSRPDPIIRLPDEDWQWAVGLGMGTLREDGQGNPILGGVTLEDRFREAAQE